MGNIKLTLRECEILALIGDDGLSAKQVAEKLLISVRTVHYHVQSIYDKLDVHSARSAYKAAIKLGVLA